VTSEIGASPRDLTGLGCFREWEHLAGYRVYWRTDHRVISERTFGLWALPA